MKEIELKFQVPPGQRKAVELAVAGQQPARRTRLQAAYFDTPGSALAQSGMALRLRKEGRVWVQTLKSVLPDGAHMTRAEHNVTRAETGTAIPDIDPQLHADTPVGAAFLKVLKGGKAHADGPLQQVMSTDIWRRSRTVRVAGGTVELSFDAGFITAGPADAPRRQRVCELEIELKSGHPHAVVSTAGRWVARHGLWLDTRSKAELGQLLRRDVAMAEPRRAIDVSLERSMSATQAMDAVLRSCLDQISVNASQIASGLHEAEHVHQLRVGLRRLRTALRFFDGAQLSEAKDEAGRLALSVDAAELFRQLGAARDQDAVAGPLMLALKHALEAVGQPGEAPALPVSEAAEPPANLVRREQTQRLLLALIGRLQGDAPKQPGRASASGSSVGSATHSGHTRLDQVASPLQRPLRERLAQRLNRWHRGVLADAQSFDLLDDEGRHRLRKHIKRLRYAVEFCASLFDEAEVQSYLKGLRTLQERLGALNNVAVGIALYSAAAPHDTRALFALGWLAARREAALAACRPNLKRFLKLPRFWRGKDRHKPGKPGKPGHKAL